MVFANDITTYTLQLVEEIARKLGILPPLPEDHVAEITKSIGTSSRDYSTITAWEADLDNGAIYTSGDTALGEGYDDSDFDEAVTINGGGTIGLTGVTLSVASGQRHIGIANTGVRMLASVDGRGITVNISGTTVQWWELHINDKSPGSAALSQTPASSSFHRCIVHNVVRAGATGGISQAPSTGGSGTITTNCIVYNIKDTATGAQAVNGIVGTGTGSRTSQIMNCTVHNVINDGGSGLATCILEVDGSGRTVKNCVATDPSGTSSGTQACYSPASPANATMSHNLSSDTSASGTGSLVSKTSANQFVSTTVGSEDLHLKTGADAIDAGTDLVTTPTGVNFDIDNRDRDAEGDTWDMGADEFVAAAAFTFVPFMIAVPVLGKILSAPYR